MTTLKLKVGNDIGNNKMKVIVNGELHTQPTAIKKTIEAPFSADVDPNVILNSLDENLFVTILSPSVAPGQYYIGHSAVLKEAAENIVLGTSKAGQDITVVGTLGTIAGALVKKYPDKDEIKASIDMAIALPITQFEEKDARLYESKFLALTPIANGHLAHSEHIVTVHLGARQVKVTITFEYVRCVQEGSAVCFALIYSAEADSNESGLIIPKYRKDELLSPLRAFIPYEDGAELSEEELDSLQEILEIMYDIEIKRGEKNWIDEDGEIYATFQNKKGKVILESVTCSGKYFESRRVLHVDIGDGTTELPVTEGTSILREYIDGIPQGVGQALERSIPYFNKETFITDNNRQFLADVLADKRHKYHAKAVKATDEHFLSQAKTIAGRVEAQLQKTRGLVDVVSIYGGGSIALQKKLMPLIKKDVEKREIFLFYISKEFAVNMNAWGLWVFVNTPIFDTLKATPLQKA
ncbi:hypothetical protein NW801_22140 [Brevibacillus laterosporus]|uniref:Actin homologue MreB-like C-terminal domain-containing protein n=1 Tax=Brevibacillus halotolerans TaxID=1507437 RepID=A0ABT4I3K4_9BACL|nr:MULTISPECIES: hypothetical protein [Brevibacillus]MCR8987694.1 hypothetical protein [Brevibacillus laterosporus]MCZ0833433.1 hypothetical protein [Brevibacillus halotolerans]